MRRFVYILMIILVLATVPGAAFASGDFFSDGEKDIVTGIELAPGEKIVHALNIYWVHYWKWGNLEGGDARLNQHRTCELSNISLAHAPYTPEELKAAELVDLHTYYDFIAKLSVPEETIYGYNAGDLNIIGLKGNHPRYYTFNTFMRHTASQRTSNYSIQSVNLNNRSAVVKFFGQPNVGSFPSVKNPQPIDLKKFFIEVCDQIKLINGFKYEVGAGNKLIITSYTQNALEQLNNWRKREYPTLFPGGVVVKNNTVVFKDVDLDMPIEVVITPETDMEQWHWFIPVVSSWKVGTKDLPDFAVTDLNPGTDKTEPGTPYTGEVTFTLKPDYKEPVEAKLVLTHNGYSLSALDGEPIDGKQVIFEPGESKTFEFKWTGQRADSRIVTEIWPTEPENLPKEQRDAKPDDNRSVAPIKAAGVPQQSGKT